MFLTAVPEPRRWASPRASCSRARTGVRVVRRQRRLERFRARRTSASRQAHLAVTVRSPWRSTHRSAPGATGRTAPGVDVLCADAEDLPQLLSASNMPRWTSHPGSSHDPRPVRASDPKLAIDGSVREVGVGDGGAGASRSVAIMVVVSQTSHGFSCQSEVGQAAAGRSDGWQTPPDPDERLLLASGLRPGQRSRSTSTLTPSLGRVDREAAEMDPRPLVHPAGPAASSPTSTCGTVAEPAPRTHTRR